MFYPCKSRRTILTAALAVASILSTATASAASVTGAGASFIYPLMAKWSGDYSTKTGNQINYQSIGSGGGIAQIKSGTVDFGSSDKPLDPKELQEAGLAQFPSAIGGVVPVVNLAGVSPGKIQFTGPLLGDIFLGKVKNWNDPAIKAVNESLTLPDMKITIIHRSDGSGTTFNWANYLSKVSPEWKTKVGEGTTVSWPVGIGGKGNEGVAAYVKQIAGGIGYIELSYALQNKMTYAAMQNAAGKFVQPSAESFAEAATSADWANAKDFFLIITNAPGEKSWPITATNFILVHRTPKDAAQLKAVKDFFTWAFAEGDEQAKALDYVPLPDALVKQIEEYWASNWKL